MSNFNILAESLDNAERLKRLHYIIDANKLPIISKDDLNHQIVEVEKFLGENDFTELNKKRKTVNIWTGILALPVLFYCIFLFLSRYAGYWGIALDVAQLNETLLMGAIHYVWLVVLYAVIFFGLIAYFYKLNKQANQAIVVVCQKLFNRIG